MSIYPKFLPRTGCDSKSIFKQRKAIFKSEFFFSYISCLTKAKESYFPYNLPIARGKRDGFIFILWALSRSDIQTVRFRI